MNYSPIIIISVFRSGSNLIKDVLCHLPGFGTWPAENINFIWRHGNSLREDDELGIAEANNNVVNYIRLAFSKFAKKSGNKYLVEKDAEIIGSYAKRRNWDMQTTESGLWYMIYKNGT